MIDAYHAVRPNGPVIILLRNPVERAYSHYKWDLFLGGPDQKQASYYRSFSDYVDLAMSLFPYTLMPSRCGFPFLESGIYFRSMELWMSRFGKQNVHVVRTEDLFKNAVATVCDIHEFLVLPAVRPTHHEVVNENPLRSRRRMLRP